MTDKATRLLAEGRVHILADEIAAIVDGDSGQYRVDLYVQDGQVVCECTCPYANYHPNKPCSHMTAVLRLHRPIPKEES